MGAVSALSWRGEAKEKQKGAARRKGAGFAVVGDEQRESGGRRRERYAVDEGNEERRQIRDTITSCTRRAWSHFQTLLHEALEAPFSSISEPRRVPFPLDDSPFSLAANFVPQRRESV